jgi:hypothetical protein
MTTFVTVENSDKKTEIMNLANIEHVLLDKTNGTVTIRFISSIAKVLKGDAAKAFMSHAVPSEA